jgi:hypothetical protein
LLGLQASPVCPSLDSRFEVSDEFKQWWSDTDGKTKVTGEKLVLVPFHSVWKGIFNFILFCGVWNE